MNTKPFLKSLTLCTLSLVLLSGCVFSDQTRFSARSIVLSGATDQRTASLLSCTDGDTAHFLVEGVDEKVRFLSIDAPEIAHEGNAAEPYGNEAADYTCDRLSQADSIILESDPYEDPKDRYGRTLAWVWVDGVLLQGLLVEAGLAEVAFVKGTNLHSFDLDRLEAIAINSKIGIWK